MKYPLLLLSCLVLSVACKSELRHPFCRTPLQQLPVDIAGFYEVTLPESSIEYSGSWVAKTMTMLMTNHSIQSTGFIGGSAISAVCEVRGRYFVEKLNAGGTYSVAELVKFSSGLMMMDMAVNMDLARAKKFEFYYLPKGDSIVREMPIRNVGGDGVLILNNKNLTELEQLAVMSPVSMLLTLRKVPVPVKFNPVFQFDLPK